MMILPWFSVRLTVDRRGHWRQPISL